MRHARVCVCVCVRAKRETQRTYPSILTATDILENTFRSENQRRGRSSRVEIDRNEAFLGPKLYVADTARENERKREREKDEVGVTFP